MKRILALFATAAALMSLPVAAQVYTQTVLTSYTGVTLMANAPATATSTSTAVRLPNFSGFGTLSIQGVGITGSPSGCTVTLAYQSNSATLAGAVQQTIAFTPAVSVQYFNITPTQPTGDQYVAVYTCSSTYPTAGVLNISFSPAPAPAPVALDPCQNAHTVKSSVAVSVTSATTTQLVALSAGKSIYVCGATINSVGGTSTLEYGTGSSCGTGTTTLTGPFAAATVAKIGGYGTTVTAPSGNALCIVSGTSTTATAGVVTYVQQ